MAPPRSRCSHAIDDFGTRAAAVALVVAPALVAGDIWDSSPLVDLRHDPAKLAAAVAVAAMAVAVAAAIFRRFPWAFPVSVFADLVAAGTGPGRGRDGPSADPAVSRDRRRAGLLRVRGLTGLQGDAPWPPARRSPAPRLAEARGGSGSRVLAATLVLYAIQSAYSEDVSNAIENACFFLVPFAVMLVLLGEVRWTTRMLGGRLVAVAGMGLLFAGSASSSTPPAT